MKKIFVMCAALLFAISGAMAQDGLQLKDIAEGKPTAERLSAVTPLGDGESYAMISSDGKKTHMRIGIGLHGYDSDENREQNKEQSRRVGVYERC